MPSAARLLRTRTLLELLRVLLGRVYVLRREEPASVRMLLLRVEVEERVPTTLRDELLPRVAVVAPRRDEPAEIRLPVTGRCALMERRLV